MMSGEWERQIHGNLSKGEGQALTLDIRYLIWGSIKKGLRKSPLGGWDGAVIAHSTRHIQNHCGQYTAIGSDKSRKPILEKKGWSDRRHCTAFLAKARRTARNHVPSRVSAVTRAAVRRCAASGQLITPGVSCDRVRSLAPARGRSSHISPGLSRSAGTPGM
jgi:hypothetical protein